MPHFPSFHYLRNQEFVHYAQAVAEQLHQVPAWFAPDALQQFEELIDDHRQAMVGKQSNRYTGILREADQLRESAYMALRDYIKACSRRLKVEWQGPSVRLLEVFRIYGWNLYTSDYRRQSSKIALLLHELADDGANESALRALDAMEWFDELREVNEQFGILLAERDRQRPPQPKLKTKETRLSLRDSIRQWVTELAQQAQQQPEGPYAEALARIEQLSRSIEQQVRQRMAQSQQRQQTRWGKPDQ